MAGLERLNDLEWQIIQATAPESLPNPIGFGEEITPSKLNPLQTDEGEPAKSHLDQLVTRSFTLAREHIRALALGLLIAVVGTFMWTNRVTGQTIDLVVSTLPQPTVTRSLPPSTVLVHVLGAVKNPGVVQVAKDARVQDAVRAAGGFTEDADPGDLNLAGFIADGAQIKIGSRKQPGGQITGGTTGVVPAGGGAAKVNLNQATLEQLDSLPGIGPVTAKTIIAWRTQNGPFKKVEQLQEVDGIGPKTFSQLREYVSV